MKIHVIAKGVKHHVGKDKKHYVSTVKHYVDGHAVN